jgi:hypothetical protein
MSAQTGYFDFIKTSVGKLFSIGENLKTLRYIDIDTTAGLTNVIPHTTTKGYLIWAYSQVNVATSMFAIATGSHVQEIYDAASVYSLDISGGYIRIDAGARVISVIAIEIG